MRKEADDIGPRAELDHWKKRMSKFNYLLDQIKRSEVKAVLGVLQAAKSKLIKVGEKKTRLLYSLSDLSLAHRLFHFFVSKRSSLPSKLDKPLWNTTACMYKHTFGLNFAK